MKFSDTRLQQIVSGFHKKKILIVGDVMIDEYLRGNVSRLSPEAPVPIIEIEEEQMCLGGAGNVALNVKTLGADPILLSVVGTDIMASRFESLLANYEMDASVIIRDSDRPTTVKTRIIGDNQHIARVDKERRNPVSAPVISTLLERLETLIPQVDAVILEDYNKGLLQPEIIRKALETAKRYNKTISVDPKFVNFMLYKGATVFKPNIKETAAALAREIRTDDDVNEAGRELLQRLEAQCVLLTRGAKGISIFESDGKVTQIPTRARTVADVSGAGDTVISTMTVALAGGASFLEAAALANLAAGIVCEEVGIVPVELKNLQKSALNN